MINEIIVEEMINFIIEKYENESEEMQEEKYNQLEMYVINKAKKIRGKLKYNNGIYYPLKELKEIIDERNNEIESFILDQLKMYGVEYYNMEFYRVAREENDYE